MCRAMARLIRSFVLRVAASCGGHSRGGGARSEFVMNKVLVLVLADIETKGDLGRVVNALETAKEFRTVISF